MCVCFLAPVGSQIQQMALHEKKPQLEPLIAAVVNPAIVVVAWIQYIYGVSCRSSLGRGPVRFPCPAIMWGRGFVRPVVRAGFS